MATNKTDIYVYADWFENAVPIQIGILTAHHAKGKKTFSFEYDKYWLQTQSNFILDPDLSLFSGAQFANEKENFGVFLDSMPDTWGRTLMKRRALLKAKNDSKKFEPLYEIDFLLGVYDPCRMGGLRYKLDPLGDFLDKDQEHTTPPWTSIEDLQKGIRYIESDKETKEASKWLEMLAAPGSSLGGARPKTNIVDKQNNLWIAKFPSKHDTIDKALWEYLSFKLAIACGIDMASSKVEKIAGKHHTFFTKRFDRQQNKRIHFASAMTMTGFNEEVLKQKQASYLDLAEFIQNNSRQIKVDLRQLWTRLLFNIIISNTDDHLRNHGFILQHNQWSLSPAFDINPSNEKSHLSLNIDMEQNDLDINLAMSVGSFFQLSENEMNVIYKTMKSIVSTWKNMAKQIGISSKEINEMESAFRV